MDRFFLKKIQNISTYIPSDSTMELLFESTEEITLSPREILIGYGMTDPSLYMHQPSLLQIEACKIRPDIINAVSNNRLAFYLGVTPSWFCKLRKKMLYE